MVCLRSCPVPLQKQNNLFVRFACMSLFLCFSHRDPPGSIPPPAAQAAIAKQKEHGDQQVVTHEQFKAALQVKL